MPKCPHCGEIYRKGQEKCYACGQSVTGRHSRGGGEGVNPLIFIIGGGVVVIALLGIFLVTSNRMAAARERREAIEQQRIADSVRQSNIAVRMERRRTRREEGVEAEIADLELRLEKIAARADRGRLTAEQTRLVADIDSRIVRLKTMLASMADRADKDQEVISDSVRTGASEIRELLSQLGRRRRPAGN